MNLKRLTGQRLARRKHRVIRQLASLKRLTGKKLLKMRFCYNLLINDGVDKWQLM